MPVEKLESLAPNSDTGLALEALPAIFDEVVPLNQRHRLELETNHKASVGGPDIRTRTQDGGVFELAAYYSSYVRYFLPWNILRLSSILSRMPLSLNAGSVLMDIGSGPLSHPIALYVARPDLRGTPLTVYCTDKTERILKVGQTIFESLCAKLSGSLPPWKIVLLRQPFGARLPEKADLITAANVFNEFFWKSKLPSGDCAPQLAAGQILGNLKEMRFRLFHGARRSPLRFFHERHEGGLFRLRSPWPVWLPAPTTEPVPCQASSTGSRRQDRNLRTGEETQAARRCHHAETPRQIPLVPLYHRHGNRSRLAQETVGMRRACQRKSWSSSYLLVALSRRRGRPEGSRSRKDRFRRFYLAGSTKQDATPVPPKATPSSAIHPTVFRFPAAIWCRLPAGGRARGHAQPDPGNTRERRWRGGVKNLILPTSWRDGVLPHPRKSGIRSGHRRKIGSDYQILLTGVRNTYIFLSSSAMTRGRSEAGLSRWPVKPEIAGSSPVAPRFAHWGDETRHVSDGFFYLRAVAQGLARLVRDQDVGGSNPLSPTNEKAAISGGFFLFTL